MGLAVATTKASDRFLCSTYLDVSQCNRLDFGYRRHRRRPGRLECLVVIVGRVGERSFYFMELGACGRFPVLWVGSTGETNEWIGFRDQRFLPSKSFLFSSVCLFVRDPNYGTVMSKSKSQSKSSIVFVVVVSRGVEREEESFGRGGPGWEEWRLKWHKKRRREGEARLLGLGLGRNRGGRVGEGRGGQGTDWPEGRTTTETTGIVTGRLARRTGTWHLALDGLNWTGRLGD
ncbi:hypothetical protein VTL71DRAFT_2635 [Oculimacula yallundae]|uniref:Uncharacterized protein n=1 Tax=Oculimacula yallundae TaxID=86028 RepID=A0ABR4C9F1_9HELO